MGNKKDVLWVEGLRGIASFMVIMTHFTRAWDPWQFSPADSDGGTPRIIQWPVIRIPGQGRLGVTIFGFLTGFVCALKPLRYARERNYNAGLTSVAKSAFRRPPRLIMPAAIAMCIAWTLAQFGAYRVATRCDAQWLRDASPHVDGHSLWFEIKRLFFVFLATWTNGHMDYDDHQWALLPLLKGSMIVYVALAATMFMKYRYRMLVYFLMMAYWHQSPKPDTETFGLQMFYGMVLSDTANEPKFHALMAKYKWQRKVLCVVLLVLGLFVGSYPNSNAHFKPWSNTLKMIAEKIFPPNTNTGKRYSALGVDMVIFAIFMSPSTKELLSNRLFLYFGKNSFAVYLIHGTLLRTLLCWMVYGTISGEPFPMKKDDEGNDVPVAWLKRASFGVMTFWILVWLLIVYACAHAWTKYVDAWCARVTQKLENRMFESEESEKGAVRDQAGNRPLLPQ
ncbi:acyltransferase [Lineolata rhizophorae]|uniref:Acyltransferase n=1 Tax=Lineolata rhizophorae TaxID=578093 RepID=A0A6A6P371_9PEZI|nr:acyltransferase [Lineolata rhizophorae]